MQTTFPHRYRLFFGLIILSLTSCSKQTPETLADKIKKNWTAQTVKESSTLVYTKGATANIRNYGSFRLNLGQSPAVTITDWDGIPATGQYEVVGDTRLVLKNLTPQLSSTNGTIEFTINSSSDSQLDLTRVTTSPKTGGTLNQYVLINQ